MNQEFIAIFALLLGIAAVYFTLRAIFKLVVRWSIRLALIGLIVGIMIFVIIAN